MNIEKLKKIAEVLAVPAAEYVPAIPDALMLIDELIADETVRAAAEIGKTQ